MTPTRIFSLLVCVVLIARSNSKPIETSQLEDNVSKQDDYSSAIDTRSHLFDRHFPVHSSEILRGPEDDDDNNNNGNLATPYLRAFTHGAHDDPEPSLEYEDLLKAINLLQNENTADTDTTKRELVVRDPYFVKKNNQESYFVKKDDEPRSYFVKKDAARPNYYFLKKAFPSKLFNSFGSSRACPCMKKRDNSDEQNPPFGSLIKSLSANNPEAGLPSYLPKKTAGAFWSIDTPAWIASQNRHMQKSPQAMKMLEFNRQCLNLCGK
nr:uncharacterized protein LOC100176372 [Ciona intestinalis]|eukprot:XP_002119915.1 uncharacterized protein LOC100176372 [Ciona intestinalis]